MLSKPVPLFSKERDPISTQKDTLTAFLCPIYAVVC